ncbi:MAG: erythromycin esterase family protein [Mucilaginibacter sp.]
MYTKNKFMVVMFYMAVLMPLGLSAQSQNELITAINGKLIPIKTITPTDDFSDLQPFKKVLTDKKVIGLGEAAHGVHEFFVFKLRLLQFLVKQCGVKALVTETDFAGTQTMNDYVLHGKGDAHKGLTDMMGSVWTTQEFIDMAEWVKSYNDTQPLARKVRIYGMDMTRGTNLVNHLQMALTATHQLTPGIAQGLQSMAKGGKLTDDDKAAIKNAAAELQQLKIDSPGEDTKRHQHLIRVAAEYADYITQPATIDPNEKNNLRDKYMAENAEWACSVAGGKIAIWAHSEHLAKKINNTGIIRGGIYLDEKFKDDYYLFGLCFNSGTIKSIPNAANPSGIYDVPPVSMANNSDALLAQCRVPNFILDFKTASADPLIRNYLHQTVSSYFIGSNYAAKAGTDQQYVQHKWGEDYDAIVYIRNVHAAEAVK